MLLDDRAIIPILGIPLRIGTNLLYEEAAMTTLNVSGSAVGDVQRLGRVMTAPTERTVSQLNQLARRSPMRRSIVLLLFFFLSLSVVLCLAQKQEYVGQYDAYFGYAYLTTPNMNLAQRGWQATVRIQLEALDGDRRSTPVTSAAAVR